MVFFNAFLDLKFEEYKLLCYFKYNLKSKNENRIIKTKSKIKSFRN